MDQDQFASLVIEEMDGNAALARHFDVSSAAISQWKINGIPRDKLKLLRLTHPEQIARAEAKLADLLSQHPSAESGTDEPANYGRRKDDLVGATPST